MFSLCFRAQIALVAFVFLFGPIQGNNWEPCGDWIAYNDEKCFKIIDDTLRTFDEAKDVCATQEHTSTLAVIRSSEEQQYLSDYLFKTEQKVENFWIGAKYSSQNGSFIWIDNSPLNYTNWDAGHSPRNLENHCVQMQADMAVVGKWKDWRCVKKNGVVCQRMQFWSTEFLQKKFLDSRKQQRDAFETIRNLTQSLTSANKRIETQKESLQNAYQRIDTHKLNMENVNQRIDELKRSYEISNQRINEQIQNCNQRINEIDYETIKKLDNIKQNLVPIGFIYVQLSGQPEPSTLWSTVQWQDVTSDYAGLFFRAEGGAAAQFGTVQEGNAPRVTQVQFNETHTHQLTKWKNTTLNVGEWSSGTGVLTGTFNGGISHFITLQFLQSGGEIRPRNMAMRLWKRIK